MKGSDKFIENGSCEKISVNSTTVIKNDIASGLKNSCSIFLQYTINIVICQASSTVIVNIKKELQFIDLFAGFLDVTCNLELSLL